MPQFYSEEMDRLGSFLLEQGLVDPKMLDRAHAVGAETGRRLDIVLTQLGIVSDKALASAFSTLLGIPIADSRRYPSEALLRDRLKPSFLRRAHAVPIAIEQGCLVVAMANPLDAFVLGAVRDATGLEARMEVAIPAELDAALARLYPESAPEALAANGAEARGRDGFEDDTERLKDLASGAPVIRLVNQMIARAVENQASDIHIEPFEDRLRVRYRYDGVLHEEEAPPFHLGAAIASRIKIMAQLDIAERRLPQDGRLKLALRGQETDFRVSTVPCVHGEAVVLRVLDRGAVTFDFAALGFPDGVGERLRGLLEAPNGIVLVTGPTGSGKTTTLYTGLLGLNSVARNIVTIEDPVEYLLAGINQIQVKPQIGLTFPALLRSILRQDPDIIMVGEIRDLETAQIAVQASLTGHLVLSTLHTNSAAATVTRLRDMGLEEYLISAALRGVVGQRLVRRLCPLCAVATPASEALVRRFELDRRTAARPIMLHHAAGCPACRNTGFRGRYAIAELLVPNEEIESLILSGADHLRIESAAVSAGMRTMFQAGLDAALAGVTSVEEVVRTINAVG